MKKNFLVLIVVLLILSVLTGAILFNRGQGEDEIESKFLSDNYYTYSPEKYRQSREVANATLLNFYADWCTTCNAMEPDIISVFSEIGISRNISGFRVHFADSKETKDARELAREFGITTQSATVILTKDGKVFKTFFNQVPREELRTTLIAATLA